MKCNNMPRNANGKKLSESWKKLHEYKKIDLNKKEDKAHNLLNSILSKHKNPIICWSGGKDSTVVLHLTLKHIPDIRVIHVDTGVLFPETNNFVKKLSKKWNLNIEIMKNNDIDFWTIVDKYGWPIFGKNISCNVGRAIRTGNIRNKLSTFEKILANNNVRLSMKCSEYLLEIPTKVAEKEYNADLKIIGIRALESRARVRLWSDYGDYYYVKRYYKRNHGIWKFSPISTWLEKDIWKYNKKYEIPHCKLYDLGYRRNGCWTCAMAIRNGQLNLLKNTHPDLYNHLIKNTDMGKEIYKAYKAIVNNNKNIGFKLDFLESIIKDMNNINLTEN